MVPIIPGNGTTLPVTGSRTDSVAETSSQRRQRPAGQVFLNEDQQQPQQSRSTAQASARPARTAASGELPFLRRRTDRGEAADPAIQIPPHLERRRAWREAFGLNTYHTQELAQRADAAPGRQLRSAATDAYRGNAARGRLDLHLAQLVSMTV